MVGKRISKRNPPHSLPTQDFDFLSFYLSIFYIQIKNGWNNFFFQSGRHCIGEHQWHRPRQANPYGVILTVYMVI